MGEGDGLRARYAGRQHILQVLSTVYSEKVPCNSGEVKETQVSYLLPPTETARIPVRGINQRPSWSGSRSHTEATG